MTIKGEVISMLTKNRELTSAERAEIDMLGVALSLRDDDPSWGQIAWAWAKFPQKEEFDIRLSAFAAEVRHDVQNLLTASSFETNSVSVAGQPLVNDKKLDDLVAMIESIASRPAPPSAPAAIDQKAIQSAVTAALSGKKSLISIEDLYKTAREVLSEVISWTIAAAAAIAVGVCLYIGYSVGEKSQASSDSIAAADIKKQNADLEQQVATLTKLVGRNR